MRITTDNINYNAVKIIKELTECLYDGIGGEGDRDWALITLGHIRGVIEMADAMKEVLKA